MKFKNANTLNELQKSNIRRLVGVRHKLPMVLAKRQGTNTWSILASDNNGPISGDKELKQIDALHSLDEVIDYFNSKQLIPYCLEADVEKQSQEKKEEPRLESTNSCHRRSQYRKNVTLEGYVINPRTMEMDGIFIKDLSFNGVGFFTTDYLPVEKGEILEIEFTLSNKKQSVIKRRVEVKHASNKLIGGEFVNKPRLDANLGFFLMFNVQ